MKQVIILENFMLTFWNWSYLNGTKGEKQHGMKSAIIASIGSMALYRS